jgi:hypothetical protein
LYKYQNIKFRFLGLAKLFPFIFLSKQQKNEAKKMHDCASSTTH